jgi:DNA-binding CsgD family transcriptional regulator/N-acetylneuraminic acid mutarotase
MWYIYYELPHKYTDCTLNMQKDLPIQVSTELTEREQEILRLLATGTSNKEIARDLFISSNTVKVHLRNIFAKIGVSSRTEAAMYAVQVGLVRSPAAPEQENGISTQAKDSLAAYQTTASEVPPRSRPFIRQASVAAVIMILAVVVGMGILLARPQVTPAAKTSQITPTAESRWHILASLPTARGGLAVTAYENQIYTIGGENTQGVTGLVERFDPTTNSWSELSQKPVPVSDVNAVVIGGKIYVPGGRLSSGEVTDALEIYDPRQDTWEKGNNLPVAMSAYAMAAFEGRLYLFGGWDGKKYLNSVYMYDPGRDQWSALTPMVKARSYASAVATSEEIFVIGGYDGKQALAINEVYTPHLESIHAPWSQAEAMPTGCYDIGVASVASDIYVIGKKGSSKVFATFNPQANQWQTIDPPPLEIGEGTRLAQLGEYLYVVGGRINNTPSGLNLAYQAIYTIQIQVIIKK